jgi:hypothetical protein
MGLFYGTEEVFINDRSEGGVTAETVLDNLPLFLHHFGSAGLPLTLELIEQAVDSKIDDVTLKLAIKAGSLVCTMTYKTKIVRSRTRESLVMFPLLFLLEFFPYTSIKITTQCHI